VLVADNYDGTRRPAAEYLSRYGFDVVEATTAAQTIAVLAERPPRVLLTGLEDDEADRLYRQVAQAPTLPVILLNADARTPPPFAPAAILAKPFHLPAMLRTLRDVLALQAIG